MIEHVDFSKLLMLFQEASRKLLGHVESAASVLGGTGSAFGMLNGEQKNPKIFEKMTEHV